MFNQRWLIFACVCIFLSLFLFQTVVNAQVQTDVQVGSDISAPALEVEIDGEKITALNPLSVKFGHPETTSFITKQIKINNTRNTTLKLKQPSLPSGFELVGEFPENITPFASAVFQVKISSVADNKKFVIKLNTREKITPVVEDVIQVADRELPVFEKIDAPAGEPGQEVVLRLTGKNFRKLEDIRTAAIGGVQTPVLDFFAESDEIVRLKIRVPENLSSGDYPLSFLTKGVDFEEWIELTPPRLAGSTTPSEGTVFKIDFVEKPDLNSTTIDEIQTSNANPGEKAIFKISGKGLANIPQIDSVKIGNVAIPALGVTEKSDTGIVVRAIIPKGIKPGKYDIAILAESTGHWIEPRNSKSQIVIIKPSFWLVPVAAIIIPLLLVAGSVVAVKKGLLSAIIGKSAIKQMQGRAPAGKFIFHFKANKDLGTQSVQQSTPLEIPFAFTLRPIPDAGEIEIKTTGKLIKTDKVKSKRPSGKKGNKSQPDDLTKIEGIGPKITQLLLAHGVTTFADLAAKKSDEIEKILDNAGLWISDPDTWPKQARLAANSQWDKLEALKKELIAGRVSE